MATLYNLLLTTTPTTTTTKTPTIGILEFGGTFSIADVNNYLTLCGIPATAGITNGAVPQINSISVMGASTTQSNPNYDTEVCVDVEIISSICPKSIINVYFAPNSAAGFVSAINAAVKSKCDVISISYGAAESAWSISDITNVNNALSAAATAGITVCVSSGDSNADDGTSSPAVNFPASSPYCLACGGTALSCPSGMYGGSGTSETVWNTDSTEGTGGGVSTLFAATTGQVTAGCTSTTNGQTLTMRGVPDVAGMGDPNNQGIYYVQNGQQGAVGGTSIVAPMWAAYLAYIGIRYFVAPVIYEIMYPTKVGTRAPGTSPFHDITSGTNNGYSNVGTPNGFSAKNGWDACTGWGSPNGTYLTPLLLSGGTTPTPNPTPLPPVTTVKTPTPNNKIHSKLGLQHPAVALATNTATPRPPQPKRWNLFGPPVSTGNTTAMYEYAMVDNVYCPGSTSVNSAGNVYCSVPPLIGIPMANASGTCVGPDKWVDCFDNKCYCVNGFVPIPANDYCPAPGKTYTNNAGVTYCSIVKSIPCTYFTITDLVGCVYTYELTPGNDGNTYNVIYFTTSPSQIGGAPTINANGSCNISFPGSGTLYGLLVGGGGCGGGSGNGSGGDAYSVGSGGGGGYTTSSSTTVNSSTVYPITIGTGGSTNSGGSHYNGQPTTFSNNMSAAGGGCGTDGPGQGAQSPAGGTGSGDGGEGSNAYPGGNSNSFTAPPFAINSSFLSATTSYGGGGAAGPSNAWNDGWGGWWGMGGGVVTGQSGQSGNGYGFGAGGGGGGCDAGTTGSAEGGQGCGGLMILWWIAS